MPLGPNIPDCHAGDNDYNPSASDPQHILIQSICKNNSLFKNSSLRRLLNDST
jgi:hypothetical protein